MVGRIEVNGKPIYTCEVCGLGYDDEETAKACQKYCSTHNACSLEITSKAIYFPKQANP
ncbi:MAG: DUF7128 family protein [Thermoproteota archaeon]